MRLKSKRIIVTGGASGIGSSICSVFASEGAKLVVADIDEDGAKKTVSLINESGGEAMAIWSDISSEKSVKSLIEQSVEFLGGIDVLVNDAAAFIFGKHDRRFGANATAGWAVGFAIVIILDLDLLLIIHAVDIKQAKGQTLHAVGAPVVINDWKPWFPVAVLGCF